MMMPNDVEVSVVVAVRNGASTVGAAVESILRVRYPPSAMEIIVVDNASTDDTRRVLASMGDRIRVLHESRRGAAAARNRGVREARGRAIAFIDADAVVEPEWLAAILSPLAEPSVGVVGGKILSTEPCNRIERFGERIHDQKSAIEQATHPYVLTGNWASRRAVLLEVGLFDESLLRGQDVDLAWRIRDAGYRFHYEPSAIVRHRNERTIAGLMHEGFVHGRNNARLLRKRGQPRLSSRVRLMRALRRLVRHEDPIEGVLWLLFDVGKIAGQVAGLFRADELPRVRGNGRAT